MKICLFLLTLVSLSSFAQATDYTWKGTGSSDFNAQSSWDGAGSSGLISGLNKNGNQFIIKDGTTITIGDHAVEMNNADLVLGNNVTLGHNWNFRWRNVTIGSGYKYAGGGDGISFYKKLSIDGEWNNESKISYKGSNGNGVAFNGGIIDLMSDGKITLIGGGHGLTPESLCTITGKLTLHSSMINADYAIATRQLTMGNLWNEERQIYSFTDENGNALTNLNAQGSREDWGAASWAESDDQTVLKAHFGEVYYTYNAEAGVIAHYIVQNSKLVPETSSATLGLLGLSLLLMRRRR